MCQRSGKIEDRHELIADVLISETFVFDIGQNIPITWPWSNNSYFCFDLCGDNRTLSDCYPVYWVRIRDLVYVILTIIRFMDPKIGFCSFSARIGAILAPQIDRLADAGFAWAPGLIVTVMSILAGIVWYETKGTYFWLFYI